MRPTLHADRRGVEVWRHAERNPEQRLAVGDVILVTQTRIRAPLDGGRFRRSVSRGGYCGVRFDQPSGRTGADAGVPFDAELRFSSRRPGSSLAKE